jgi:hypothetical protein
MKRSARVVYRIRAVWRERTWVVQSPDLEVLLVHAHRFDEVAPVARNAIARLQGVHSSTIDVAVQPVSLADPALQLTVERALVGQEHAKAVAEEAADRTMAAADALYAAGMCSTDVEQLVGLTKRPAYDRGMGRYGVQCLDDDPWLRTDDEDEWNPVDPWNRWYFSDHDPTFPARLLRALGAEVGGPAELAVVDDIPLPDEEFTWEGIADDIVTTVADVLVHCDAACDAVFDSEARTAARRLLAYLARRSPATFRRRGTATGAAGAVCWMIGSANHLFAASGPRHKDLSAALGVTNAGGRGPTFMLAGGFAEDRWSIGRVELGSPAFLVAAHRRRIIELRDQYTVMDDDGSRV